MSNHAPGQSGHRHTRIIDRLPSDPAVSDLRQVIEKLRNGPCHITLDGAEVVSVPIDAQQALAVIHKTQIARGDRFKLQSPSNALSKQLGRYGLGFILSQKETT